MDQQAISKSKDRILPRRPISVVNASIIASAFIFGSILFTYLALDSIKQRYDKDLRAHLAGRLISTKNTLRVWYNDQVEDIESLVEQDKVIFSTKAILAAGSNELKNRQLDQFFLSLIENTDYLGLSVTDMNGRVLFSRLDYPEETLHPIFSQRASHAEQAIKDGTAFVPPFIPEDNQAPDWLKNRAISYFTSVISWQGREIGFLHARINPYASFSNLTKSSHFAITGETYAVDQTGRLLTPSRFKNTLLQRNLLQPSQESIIRIGYDDQQDFRKLAFDHVIGGVFGDVGIDLTGPLNYLKQKVVRSYLWFAPMDIGLISEQAYGEAYKGYLFTRDTFIAAAVAIASMLIFGILYLYRSSNHYYQFARLQNESLEQRVHERTEELERSESFLLQILDNLPLLVSIKNAEGKYRYINRQFETLFNIGRESLLGNTDRVIFNEEIATRYQLQNVAIFEEKRAVKFEECFTDSEGDPRDYIMIKLPLYKKAAVDAVLTVGVDITERKTFERDITQAKIEAERASQAKSEFLAGMSHELHTPMNGLLGMQAKLLTTEIDSDQRGYLTIAQDCAYNLLNTINDILDLSKLDVRKISLDKKAFDLNVLLEQAMDNHRVNARRKNLTYELHNQLGPIKVLGDSVRLLQVLNNLISNAIKFTSQGYVKVHARLVKKQRNSLRIRFSVIDSGIGFDQDESQMLFDRFKQLNEDTTREFDGLGVGLSIVHELVTLMGGKVRAKGVKGHGAEFHVDLSFTTVGEEEYEYQLEREELIADEEPSIIEAPPVYALLVEDNAINQIVAEELLTDLNIHCHIAQNGKEALEKLAELDPLPDIVFMDCRMPVLDGYETTKRIRNGEAGQAASELPVIALTANTLDGDKEKCLAAGMTDFVGKPYTRGEIQTVLKRWLHYDVTIEQ